MLTYLHDIRNKLTLISGHTALLSKKYGEEDFNPIRINLMRINEIINDAYRFTQEQLRECRLSLTSHEFIKQMDLLTDTVTLLYPIEMKNEVNDYHPRGEFEVDFDIGLIFQVLENAIDNSIKARATKLNIRLLESGNYCIFEIVDNGTIKECVEKTSQDISIIPHGIGKEIMDQNMRKLHGKVEWTRRIDHSGMIVRLYFPKKT
jgi:signal transduction histidine kinase